MPTSTSVKSAWAHLGWRHVGDFDAALGILTALDLLVRRRRLLRLEERLAPFIALALVRLHVVARTPSRSCRPGQKSLFATQGLVVRPVTSPRPSAEALHARRMRRAGLEKRPPSLGPADLAFESVCGGIPLDVGGVRASRLIWSRGSSPAAS
jgi:hypothetical protein